MATGSSTAAQRLAETIASAREMVDAARKDGAMVGLVPTMGFFHEGHLSLMRAARSECDFVAVTIFVNPRQFGEGEDLERYPRDPERDLELAAAAGVDLVFMPGGEEMYPPGFETAVTPGATASGLCGASRPGHFSGVLTVVAKLLNIFTPGRAYFGWKDAQQAAVVARMIDDLNFPVTLRVLPTVREDDGLAMSSRNAYLGPEERRQAAVIYAALEAAREAVLAGESDVATVRQLIADRIGRMPLVEPEYIEIVDARTMQPAARAGEGTLAAVAARVGAARLIDNIHLGREEPK